MAKARARSRTGTKKAKRNRDGVSLALELGHVQGAVAAARILADAIGLDSLPTQADAIAAPAAVASVLELAETRLRLLLAVLAGDRDAVELKTPWNVVEGGLEGDVVL